MTRLIRLQIIIRELEKKDLNPQKIGFADFVQRKCIEFGLTLDTAREYSTTLCIAWRDNKWKSLKNLEKEKKNV